MQVIGTVQTIRPRRRGHAAQSVLGVAVGVVLAAISITGCSANDSSSESSGSKATEPTIAKLLPASYRESGTIKVSGSQDVPPWNYLEGTKVSGINVELLKTMGKMLGVKFTYQRNAFSSELPALQAQRFDLIMDEIADTEERVKLVNFVDYGVELNSIVVKKGNPLGIEGLAGLCGRSVALQPGQSAIPIVEAQQPKCEASGKAKIKVVSTPTTSSGYTSVSSGRVDATMNGFSTMAYTIKQGGAAKGLEIAPGSFGRVQVGIAYRKTDDGLGKALQAALQKMMDDGSYAAIMKKYGVSDLSLKTATINNFAANED